MKHHYLYKINKNKVILYKRGFFSALLANSIPGINYNFTMIVKKIACK